MEVEPERGSGEERGAYSEQVEATGTNGLTVVNGAGGVGLVGGAENAGDTHGCSSGRHPLVAAKRRAAFVQAPHKPPLGTSVAQGTRTPRPEQPAAALAAAAGVGVAAGAS